MKLVEAISSYIAYLSVRNKAMKVHHSSPEPSVSFSDASTMKFVPKSASVVSPLLSSIDTAVKGAANYEIIHVNSFAPLDKRKRYCFMINFYFL